MTPPPYSTRLPPGSYAPRPTASYTNNAFVPSAPPAYDEISEVFEETCQPSRLPRYSPASYSRRRSRRSPSPRNLFVLWVCLILVPTVIIVGTLAVILIASE